MLGNYGPMPGMGGSGSGGGGVSGMTLEQALSRVQLAQKNGDRKNEAIHRLIMGKIFLESGCSGEALREAQQALSLFREIKNTIGEASCQLLAGQIHYLEGKFPLALKTFEEAMAIYKRFGDQAGQALVHSALAAVYFDNPAGQDMNKVTKHLNEAIFLYQKVGDYQSRQSAIQTLKMCQGS